MKKNRTDSVRFDEQMEFWKEEASKLGLRMTDLQKLSKKRLHKHRRHSFAH